MAPLAPRRRVRRAPSRPFSAPKLRHPRTITRPSQAGSCTLMSSPGVMIVQLQPAFSSLFPHSSPVCPHLYPTPVIGGLLARTDPASFVTAPGPYLGLRPQFLNVRSAFSAPTTTLPCSTMRATRLRSEAGRGGGLTEASCSRSEVHGGSHQQFPILLQKKTRVFLRFRGRTSGRKRIFGTSKTRKREKETKWISHMGRE